jgi:hypothetical protein
MSTTTCPPLPDYLTLRKENLVKIQKYYTELLKGYSGLKADNLSNAQNLVGTYHTQLNSAAVGLVDNLNKTIDLVTEQHTSLDENNKLVVANRQRLTQLKKDIKSLSAENDARRKNAAETHDNTKVTSYWHIGFLVGNILLLLVAVGLLILSFMSTA